MIDNVLSSYSVLYRKEEEFIEPYKHLTLDELQKQFGIYTRDIDFPSLCHRIDEDFLQSLLQDEDFLNLHVVSHFKVGDTWEIFGLAFVDAYECGKCDSMMTEWLALILDYRDGTYTLNKCSCCDFHSVRKSEFVGKPLHNVKKYIKENPDLDIFT